MKLLKLLAFVFVIAGSALSQVTLTTSGNWSVASNWDSGYVPTAASDVIIPSGKTDSIDIANAECKNLTVSGNLYFARTNGNGITVHGNTQINAGGRIRMSSATPTAGQFYQTIELKGDLTVASTGTFDMRQSSGAIGSVGRVVFSGSSNSTVSLALTAYTSASEEFNSVVINKSGGGKVILSSGNMFLSNNSSNMPDTLIFTSGVFETGSNKIIHLATGASSVTAGSASSHVYGILGRGISNSSGTGTREFYVGDGTYYRPIGVKYNGPVNATGHYMWVRSVSGDANTGSSALSGGIDKVSKDGYYEIGYVSATSPVTSMPVYGFVPAYSTDDGVLTGNMDLRVAYSNDNRATWNNIGPSSHSTNPPSSITSDSASSNMTLASGSSIFVSLANATSGVNPLPVELTRFTARTLNGVVLLEWSTATELNNAGFDVEKRMNGVWSKIGSVEGNGTTNAPKSYRYTDAVSNAAVSYRLKQIDRDGGSSYSNSVEVTGNAAPAALEIVGNYPNPFNPSTSIRFTVPSDGHAVVKVYNVIGREVATVFDGPARAGVQNAAEFSAVSLSTGIYFSRLEFNGKNVIGKMILMK